MKTQNTKKLNLLKDLFLGYKWDFVFKNLNLHLRLQSYLKIGNKKQLKEFIALISSENNRVFEKYGKLFSNNR